MRANLTISECLEKHALVQQEIGIVDMVPVSVDERRDHGFWNSHVVIIVQTPGNRCGEMFATLGLPIGLEYGRWCM